MRRYTDGAESGDLSFWNTVYYVTANSSTKRSGAYSYYFSSSSYYVKKLITPLYEFYYRFAVYMSSVVGSSSAKILTWGTANQTQAGYLNLDTLGRVLAYDTNGAVIGTTTRSLKTSQWNLIELHLLMSTTTGKIGVKLNTINEIDYTGATESYDAPCNILQHGPLLTHYLDDIALNDTTGSVNNSWCGDGHLEILKPNGYGDVVDWIPNTGTNWGAVDEVPSDGDTTYVTTSGIGIQDMYSVSAYVGTNKVITQMWAEAVAKDNVGLGTGILKIGFKIGGQVYLSSGTLLSSVYDTVVGDVYATNPYTTSGWTETDINNTRVVIESD